MKIHSKDASRLLHEKAKLISQAHENWRAVHFDFSGGEECSDGLRTHYIVQIIKELLAEEEGTVYLCEDKDVVILFQGAASAIVGKLGAATGTFFTVLDLSRDWQRFFNLCQSKNDKLTDAVTPVANVAPRANAKIPKPNEQAFVNALAKRQARRKPLALLVEDDAFTRRLVNGVIKNRCDVIEAADGTEGLNAYSIHAPDIVFLDIELPDVNGQVVLQKLIAMDNNPFIVMLSGSSFKENILAALEVGAKGFLTKPFTREKLEHYLNTFEQARAKSHNGMEAGV